MTNPEVLYKYCPPERIVDIIEKCQVLYTRRESLNDMYELAPDIAPPPEEVRIFNKALQDWKEEDPEWMEGNPRNNKYPDFSIIERPHINEILMHIHIFSLSSEWNLIPLWAYYAASATGFVVGFSRQSELLNNSRAVKYSDKFPNFYKNTNDVAYTKFKQWEHEHEWRSVRIKNEDVFNPVGEIAQGYLFEFQPDLIQEVIIGHKMHRCCQERLVKLLKDKEFEHVKVYKLVPQENNWELSREQIPR